MDAAPVDRRVPFLKTIGRSLLILTVILVSSPAGRPGGEIAAPNAPDDPVVPFAGDCNSNGIPDNVEVSPYFDEFVFDPDAPGARSVFAADLDGDGDRDLLGADSDGVAWYENADGVASFSEPRVIADGTGFGEVRAADIDGDGDNDVIAMRSSTHARWYENTDGAASFGPERPIIGSRGARAVDVADIDGDGDNDLLLALGSADRVKSYENTDGAGNFALPRTVGSGNDPSAVDGADLDGDGDVDVVFASRLDDKIAWHENLDGAGTWGPQQIITQIADGILTVQAADLNLDGDVDVLAAYDFDDAIVWFQNLDGAGLFSTEVYIDVGPNGPRSISAPDLDGDGDRDVLVASYWDDTIDWYENTNGFGAFAPRKTIEAGLDRVGSVTAADLDGEGHLDLVAAMSGADDAFHWFENQQEDCNSNGIPDSCEDPGVAIDCTDVDFDGHSATTDCDDGNPNCTTDCTDADGDGYCVTSDCDETDSGCFADCTDADGDGLCPPADCDDLEFDCTTDCTDADLDGLAACAGDCDDAAAECGSGDCTADCDGNDVPDPCDNAVGFSASQISGTGADLVLVEDLDGDGDRDLLATLGPFSPHELVWYRNVDGTGGAWEPPRSVTGQSVGDADLADFDGDGDLDILADVGEALSWFSNLDGEGNFGPPWPIAPGFRPSAVVAADLDGDGDPDALAASAAIDQVAWYENLDGVDAFGSGQVVDVGSAVNGAASVAAGDLDGDGDLDVLVISQFPDKISWYENADGAGNFGSQQVIGEFSDVRLILAADIDGDDDLDVLTVADGLLIWVENGDGEATFALGKVIASVSTGRSIFAADLDGDGDVDVVTGSSSGLWYSENRGQGSFGPQRIVDTEQTYGVYAANVDGDGDVDVVGGHATSDGIRWYENLLRDCNNDGVPDSCQDPDVAGGCVDLDNDGVASTEDCDDQNPNCTTDCTDADGDGHCVTADCDDSLSHCTSDCVACLDSDCDANDQPDAADTSVHFATVVLDTFTGAAGSIHAADLDGDGDRDLLAGFDSGGSSGIVAWYENTDNAGTFGPRQTISTAVAAPRHVLAVDVDGDGDRDVLAGEAVAFGLYWFENTGGDPWPQHTINGNVGGMVSLVAADLDGDGDDDVIGAFKLGNQVVWWENTGGGSFLPLEVIYVSLDGDPIAATVADVDHDGDVDVLAGYDAANAVLWHVNVDGDGSFDFFVNLDSSVHAESLFASDLDGDGDRDVLAALPFEEQIAWYENEGAGAFGPRQPVLFVANPESVVTADLDDDGDEDVLNVSSADGVLWSEQTDGTFALPRFVSPGPISGQQVVAADLDGDGDVDAASASLTVSWHENLRDDCNANQLPDVCEDPSVTDACTDFDADGFALIEDCDDADTTIWTDPRPIDGLTLSSHGPPGETALAWPPPGEPGAIDVRYDLLRSTAAYDFLDPATFCLEQDELDRLALDDEVPVPEKPFYYLIRVENDCPGGVGAMGADSEGIPRSGLSCP